MRKILILLAVLGVSACNGKDYATVDCVSGATISSKFVRENLKAAYDYYTEHK